MRIVEINDTRMVLRVDRSKQALLGCLFAMSLMGAGVALWGWNEDLTALLSIVTGCFFLFRSFVYWRSFQYIELDRFSDQITITDCSMKHKETRAIALSDLKEVRADRREYKVRHATVAYYALVFRTASGEEDVFKRDLMGEDAATGAAMIRRWLDGKPQLD